VQLVTAATDPRLPLLLLLLLHNHRRHLGNRRVVRINC